MTAIIGVLNRSAVAIAADSAVSIDSGGKFKAYNHANKIFNLSSNHAIAILIYNSASLLGIPWETIIKSYRKKEKSFNSVKAYRADFINFVKSFEKKYHKDGSFNTLNQIAWGVIDVAEKEYMRQLEYEEEKLNELPSDKIIIAQNDIFKQVIKSNIKAAKNLPSIQIKESIVKNEINSNKTDIDNLFEKFCIHHQLETKQHIEAFYKLIYMAAVKEVFLESHTGLAFCGFGDDEIFPSCYRATIGGFVGEIRYSVDNYPAIIENSNTSSIVPLAQTDIMSTFIEGIDPSSKENLPNIIREALAKFKDVVVKSIDNSSENEKKLGNVLEKSIDDIVQILSEDLEKIRRDSHVQPMLDTISFLSKEDLAELAESLINLTYLKRRVTFDEESVGGPVDVAVITKGDGFIWIKRKHYFEPELNLQYIANVIKS
ncbi:MAG: hypothetical protein ABJH05_11695 [Fulvivirga sp.]